MIQLDPLGVDTITSKALGSLDLDDSEVDEAPSTGPRGIEAPQTFPANEANSTVSGDVIETSFVSAGASPSEDGDQAGQSSSVDVAPSSESDDDTQSHCEADLRGGDAPVSVAVDTPSTASATAAESAVLPIVEFKSPRHRAGRRPSPYPAAVGIARVLAPNSGEE